MSMTDEPMAMAEIREIREKLSEKLNKMTPKERISYSNNGINEFEKKFGFKLRRQKKEAADSVKL